MGVMTGALGVVDGSNTVGQWNINYTNDLQAYVASNTKSATGRKGGNKDWSGQYNALGHTPVRMPGDNFTFTGSLDNTDGATGPAMCESVEINIDIAGAALIAHVVNFAANGALVLGSAAATDTTVPDPPSSLGCKVEWSDPAASPSWAELTNVRTMQLRIARANPTVHDSSTAGETLRKPGPIDLSFSIALNFDDPSNLPVPGTVKGLRFYVTSTTYWEILWGMFGDVSDVAANIREHAIVGCTLNGSLTAYTDVSGTPTEGSITKPDTSVWWPPT